MPAVVLCFLVGNLGLEFFFERHDQFHGIERVSAEIVNERSVVLDFVRFDPQLLRDDSPDLIFYSSVSIPFIK